MKQEVTKALTAARTKICKEDRKASGILNEPVPKLIDCALKRTVLDQALAVFMLKPCKTAFFKGCCSKTEVLEQP
jgi:hypothetical protein